MDTHWFNEIRKVRNRLVHDGASCFIFENENEPLFQAYTLEVDNLLDASSFLSNGNAISCKYFIASTAAQLIFFLDTTFRVLKNGDKNQNFDYLCCNLNYEISNSDKEKELQYLDELYAISHDIPIYQKSLFTMVQQYLSM